MIRDTVKNIADIIERGGDVALYAASQKASQIAHVLQKNYGVSPRCIVDSDCSKQGKYFHSLPILSLEQAAQKWHNLYFFCASALANSSIIGMLIEKGIPKESIINYEPVEKRVSCFELENSCRVVDAHITFCCVVDRFRVVENSEDYAFMIESMVLARKKILLDIRNNIPTPCSNCFMLKENWHFKSESFQLLSFGDGGLCNFRCQYCIALKENEWDLSKKVLDFSEFTETLIEHNKTSDVDIEFAAGEIAVHPERKMFYGVFQDYSTKIFTNASIYCPDLAEVLRRGFCTLVTSIDAGTKATFDKIKNNDCFEKVIDNLDKYREYAGYPAYVLKYLFISGVNDNPGDICGFIEIVQKLTPPFVIISYDVFADKKLDSNTIDSIKSLYNELDCLGILVHIGYEVPWEYRQLSKNV